MESASLLPDFTISNSDGVVQAIHALFTFLGLSDKKAVTASLQQQRQRPTNKTKQPLAAIQQPHEGSQTAPALQQRNSVAQIQKAKRAADSMPADLLLQQLKAVYAKYLVKAGANHMGVAHFLHVLFDAQLLNNRFGILEGHEVFLAAEAKEQAGKRQTVAGLTLNGFIDALHRVAAVKFTKTSNLEEAYRRLVCHWILPYTQEPSLTAFAGLFTPKSQAMLGRVDGTLKQIFAWYASLPFLTGQVAWDQLKHTHKGIMPGHILLFLTDFKVVPGLLPLRQVTGLLQQHAGQTKGQDSSLQYPQMLAVLCDCAVLLRQQVQRKLAGPWVNITELNALKRLLKLQSMPSIQEAYALPDSPHHIATLANTLQKVRLTTRTQAPNPFTSSPTSAWSQPQPEQGQSAQSQLDISQGASANAALRSAWPQFQAASSPSLQSSSEDRQHRGSFAAMRQGRHGRNNAAGGQQPDWRKSRAGQRAAGLLASEPMQQEMAEGQADEHAVRQQLQEQACRRHLAWREVAKRRLLQHRMERLSSDPRMPARLAQHPSHMACSMTPPYALLDATAPTPRTALNMDGDGWACRVDLVSLAPPSRQCFRHPCQQIAQALNKKAGNSQSIMTPETWGELPMQTLQRIPLDGLHTTKLGKRTREAAWEDDDCMTQLAAFDSRLPSLLHSWSIEAERQQWKHAGPSVTQIQIADAA